MSQDETLDQTMAPPTDAEPATNPDNPKPEQRVALRPQAVPADLESTQLASSEPPEWFKSSYIGQALSKFAGDADDIRKGRTAQHKETLNALGLVNSKLGRFGERIASLESTVSKLGRNVGSIQQEQERQARTYEQERRDIRSLITTAMLRLELLENGHEETQLQDVTILVVEDEQLLAKTLVRWLARDGANVLVANNWDEAKNVVDRRSIDFALVDVRLGGGEDGIQLAEWLMKRLGLPVERFVLMTGYMDPIRSELVEEMGLRVIDKPFPGELLVRLIREGLDVPGAAPPG